MITSGQYPYYIIFFIILLLSCFFDFVPSTKRNRTYIFALLSLILILFAGLRCGWRDQDVYLLFFNQAPSLSELLYGLRISSRFEYFFVLINSIVKSLFNNPTVLFLTMAFLGVSINLSAYKKYSPAFFLSVLLYFSSSFFFREMVQIRCGVAAALILFSIQYLADKKFAKFIVLVSIAFLFHSASIIVLLGWFLFSLKPRSRDLLILLFTASIIGLFSPLAYKLFDHLIILASKFPFLERGIEYYGSESFGLSLGVFRPTTLKQLIICLFALKNRKLLTKQYLFFEALFVFYCTSTIWLLLFNDFAIFAARIATFLSVGEPVIMAMLLFIFKPEHRIFFLIFLFFLAFSMLFFNIRIYGFPDYLITYSG